MTELNPASERRGFDRCTAGLITVIIKPQAEVTSTDIRHAMRLLGDGVRPIVLAGQPTGLVGAEPTGGAQQSTFMVGEPRAIISGLPDQSPALARPWSQASIPVTMPDALSRVEQFCLALGWTIETVAAQFYGG